jgi:type IV pilus assembly protein PilC
MHFSRQLGAFLQAGIPLVQALRVIEDEVTNKLMRAALSDVIGRLEAGDLFAEAAAAHPEAFPPFYIGILRSAELTGNMDTALGQLSDYIERDMDARHKTTSALVYPGMVLGMSVVTVGVLAVFVMPRFVVFFKSFKAKLPLPTRILLGFSHFLSAKWYMVLGPLIILGVTGWLVQRTEEGRFLRDRAILATPVLGDLVRFTIVERFCRVLSSMVRAGVSLPEAMLVITDGINSSPFKRALLGARSLMMQGEGLAGPLAESGLFPVAARQMFRVGEETGTLEEQMVTAATYFDRELDYKIKRFTSMFEPAVIIIMGLVVGFVAIALVTAMYGIYSQVKV